MARSWWPSFQSGTEINLSQLWRQSLLVRRAERMDENHFLLHYPWHRVTNFQMSLIPTCVEVRVLQERSVWEVGSLLAIIEENPKRKTTPRPCFIPLLAAQTVSNKNGFNLNTTNSWFVLSHLLSIDVEPRNFLSPALNDEWTKTGPLPGSCSERCWGTQGLVVDETVNWHGKEGSIFWPHSLPDLDLESLGHPVLGIDFLLELSPICPSTWRTIMAKFWGNPCVSSNHRKYQLVQPRPCVVSHVSTHTCESLFFRTLRRVYIHSARDNFRLGIECPLPFVGIECPLSFVHQVIQVLINVLESYQVPSHDNAIWYLLETKTGIGKTWKDYGSILYGSP